MATSDLPAETEVVDLPPGWARTTLGEAFEWGSGGTPLRTKKEFYGGAIPWAVIGDLNDGIVSETTTRLSEQGLGNSSAKWVEPGWILLAMYGSIGKLGIAGTRITTNQAIAFAKTGPIEAKYLFYYLRWQRNNLVRLGGGATQKNISQATIKKYPFVVAPRAEQVRIVSKIEELLSQLDAGVTALERIRANLRRYKASVLQAACEGRLVPHDQSEEPAAILLDRILVERRANWEAELRAKGKRPEKAEYVERDLPDAVGLPHLPEGWCWTRIAHVGEVKLGRQRAPRYHQGPNMRPYLRVANVFEDRIVTSGLLEMDFSPKDQEVYRLQYGDILLNEGQSPELLGRPAMYRDEIPGACFQNTLIRLRCYANVVPEYALLVFRWFMHSGRFTREATITTNIAHLSAGRFSQIEFPLPPRAEQVRIVEESSRVMTTIAKLEDDVSTALMRGRALRHAILRAAFSGRLVPQDAGEEPASALLASVRAGHAKKNPALRRRG
jgi:type I restriction enzyme S subunit